MLAAVAEDVGTVTAFDGQSCRFHRVAVTEAQVNRLALPTAPPKATDNRGAWRGGGTVQAEAMPPNVLIFEVRAAVDGLRGRRGGRSFSGKRRHVATYWPTWTTA